MNFLCMCRVLSPIAMRTVGGLTFGSPIIYNDCFLGGLAYAAYAAYEPSALQVC